MFTGIVRFIFQYRIENHTLILYTNYEFVKFIKLGDSVSVNGVCLTIVTINNNFCTFYLTEETFTKTHFNFYKDGLANVELAVKYGDHLGGHLILGHINDIGKVVSFNKDNGELWLSVNIQNVKYKGSVSINGVSLTVAEIKNDMIRIALIPETINRTIPFITNNLVNIEYDNYQSHVKEINFMRMAIEEGEKGRIHAPPNPWVGCVIVKNGKIIGKGHHEKCGSNHAEINAINNCSESLEGATMYVTLEPCCLFPGKRTPSCAERIVQEKITKVVIGVKDPNPSVSGKGSEILKKNGVQVIYQEDQENLSETGERENEIYNELCYSLRHYLHFVKTGLPYITLKIALSADGCYRDSEGSSKWITHEESRKMGHYLRSTAGAVMVGASTVVQDDPELTVRYDLPYNDNYLRVVMDGNTIKHKNYKIFRSAESNTISSAESNKSRTIICTQRPDFYRDQEIITKTSLKEIIREIGVMHILVEGGGKLHKSFCEAGLVQEIVIFRSGKIFGNMGYQWTTPKLNTILKTVKTIEHVSEKNTMETYLVNNSLVNNNNNEVKFDDVELAIESFKNGSMVLVMDDENRENEGDLIVAANLMTETQMTEMINMTTGIICTPMDISRAKKLNLELMCQNNTDKHQTAFTVSVDSIQTGTGVSSKDRLATVHALADINTRPLDLRRPGHIFPLISKFSLKERRGHTEAAVTLCKLANIYPRVAVIGELQNKDGSMKKRDECFKYAKDNNIPIITIDQLEKVDDSIKILSECELYTKYSDKPWRFLCFDSGNIESPHRVLIYNLGENISEDQITNVRIHSDCFTGDVLSSVHCDCGDQLDKSIRLMVLENNGVLIFPAFHEGRGIGIVDKIKSYKLQKDGVNTFEANKILGHNLDARTYLDVNKILDYLQIDKITLLTENPDKIKELNSKIISTRPILVDSEGKREKYLNDKREYFKTLLSNNKEKMETGKETKETPNPIVNLNGNYKVGIVYSMWHSKYIDRIRDEIKNYLSSYLVEDIYEYEAPGSNEIPFVASKIAKNVDGIICIGILIKGDTLHFENVSTAVSNGIMQAQIQTGVPMMNVILSCYNFDQVEERINGDKSTLEYVVKGLLNVMEIK